ncbi:AMIN domain-containing protein [Maridesulfovibrio hydrothermalis]|nr:AMIN domain-containing protein [Maridesulfovibrio hydrothermalis]
MTKKSRKIVQCPFCDSNRLYFRRGLVSDVLISLLLPLKSYTCGSCSRSFRRFGNYFTSKQALVHVFGLLAILALINPQALNPQNWFLEEQKIEVKTTDTEKAAYDLSVEQENPLLETTAVTDIPLLSMAITNSTNSSFIVENGTISVISNATNSTFTKNIPTANTTSSTILSFNGTDVINATEHVEKEQITKSTPEPVEEKHGLQNGKLKSIYFKAVDGKTRINLDLGGSPLSYTSFFLRTPDRLVVDIHGNWDYFGPTTLKPENPIFSKFRIGIYDDKIRMVMDLKGQTPAPVITKTGTGLNIDVK